MNEAMKLERYHRGIQESGPLKLRATALLALGDEESLFEAAALFHEAVRAEARALRALPSPSAETELAFAIERCFCLIEGLDPQGAAWAFRDINRLSERVPEASASAMRLRIDSRYPRIERDFRAAVRDPRPLSMHFELPASHEDRRRLCAEIERLLARYPGVAELWYNLSRLESRAGAPRAAGAALARALRLKPPCAVVAAKPRNISERPALTAIGA